MLLSLLVAAAVTAPQPSPSAIPLKVIKHVYSTPFCTAFQQNIRRAVEGMLMNDDLVKRSGPVFAKTAHDMVTSPPGSSFNSRRPAAPSMDTPVIHFDMERLRDLAYPMAHNLKVIDQMLDDAQRFPKSATNDEMKQLLALRDQLRKIAKAQNDELNVLSGTAESYMMDQVFNKDVSSGGALSSNGSPPPADGTLQGGPMVSKVQAGDPELTQNSLFMDTQIGGIYRDLLAKETSEQQLEQTFTPQLTAASKNCGT